VLLAPEGAGQDKLFNNLQPISVGV
jgi:hypothetical protein